MYICGKYKVQQVNFWDVIIFGRLILKWIFIFKQIKDTRYVMYMYLRKKTGLYFRFIYTYSHIMFSVFCKSAAAVEDE